MEESTNIPSGDAMNNAYADDRQNEKKQVGFGSSIQTDSNGRRNRPVDKDKVAAEQEAIKAQRSAEEGELGHS